MNIYYLKALVNYVEQGGVLKTYANFLDSVRKQFYAEN